MGKATRRFFHTRLLLLGGLLGLAPMPAPAAKLDAEEFAVPLQVTAAPSLPRRNPGRVRVARDAMTGETALHAKTAQDAIAAAVGQRAAGCWLIRFGGAGFGWVATGTAEHATATPSSAAQRTSFETRFKAFVDARTRLTGCLRALSPEARRRVTGNLEQNDALRLALINLAANDQERHEQALGILARGFVAYAVEDDPAGHAIRVHLVTTPKTATRLTRPTASTMEATSLREGLRQTQAEVESGLIPPVGNRIIVVNATGELALVGYAVTVISVHPEPVAQDQLRAAAGKTAATRATEAILGLAAGDDAGWQGGLSETSREEIRTAASGYQDAEPSANRFGQIRDLIMTTVKDDPGLQALREGRLPLAATVKRFFSEETVAVMVSYVPLVKKRAISPPVQPAAPLTTPPPESPAPTPTMEPASVEGR